MAQQPIFRRIVLGLPYNRSGHGMRLAAEIARLLQLDLFGLFVEDERLLGLAALPFVREFQLLGGGWRPLDVGQLSRDLEIAARNAEREFADTARTLQTTCRFEIVRGSMPATIASVSRPGDIVLLMEPSSPAESATQQFLATLDAAFCSSAAVLLVPGRVARESGPIVAIATGPDDPSIATATAVAIAAKEDLIIVETFRSAGEGDRPRIDLPTGARIRQLPAAAKSPVDAPAIVHALSQLRERLLVMTRRDNSVPPLVASMRRVPILIVEPAGEGTTGGSGIPQGRR